MTHERLIIGIDPGLRGGLAFLKPDGRVQHLMPMPIRDGALNAQDLLYNLSYWPVDEVYLEEVTPRPGQAVQAIRTSCVNWGVLRGLLAALKLRTHLVHPATWTREMHARGQVPRQLEDTKEKSLFAAKTLFPTIRLNHRLGAKAHDGIVDALLIAEYGRSLLIPEVTLRNGEGA